MERTAGKRVLAVALHPEFSEPAPDPLDVGTGEGSGELCRHPGGDGGLTWSDGAVMDGDSGHIPSLAQASHSSKMEPSISYSTRWTPRNWIRVRSMGLLIAAWAQAALLRYSSAGPSKDTIAEPSSMRTPRK